MAQPPAAYWDVTRVSSFIEFMSMRNFPKTTRCACFRDAKEVYRIRPGMCSMFLSGSYAEFYIDPFDRHYDDMDRMFMYMVAIAHVGDQPSMPCDVRGLGVNMRCLQITPSAEFPGYCQLLKTGILTFCWKTEKYDFIPCAYPDPYLRLKREIDDGQINHKNPIGELFKENFNRNQLNYLKLNKAAKCEMKGPARFMEQGDVMSPMDEVFCFWCFDWPTDAVEWQFRERKYGWPTEAMIQYVVRNGCHIVAAYHPDCPTDRREYQFRFSFSYAEVILIGSWTPVQQVVYHILRVFCKRMLIVKECPKENQIITGYHLKTIMLWTSENKPLEWWHSAPIIVILSQILSDLGKWLRSKNIPNYFIQKTNLLRSKLHTESFCETLQKIDQFSNYTDLSEWFLVNHMAPIFEVVITVTDENDTRNEFIAGRRSYKAKNVFRAARLCVAPSASELTNFAAKNKELAESHSMSMFNRIVVTDIGHCILLNAMFNNTGLTSKMSNISINFYPPQLRRLNTEVCLKLACFDATSPFSRFCSSLLLLCIEYNVACGFATYYNEVTVDIIRGIAMEKKILCLKSHNYPPSYRSRFQPCHVIFLRAQEVLETITSPTPDPEFRLVSRIALGLLRQCLEIHQAENESIRLAAVVYMAALYYAALDHQATIQFCYLAKRFCKQQKSKGDVAQRDARALNAFCLLFIDDVARITGFLLLFKMVQNPLFFAQERLHLLLQITPQVFVEYLLSSAKEQIPDYSESFKNSVSETFLLDTMFIKIAMRRRLSYHRDNGERLCDERRCVYLRNGFSDVIKLLPMQSDEETMTRLLSEWCLHEMTTFSRDALHQWGIEYDPIDCYRALYLYRCGRYTEVNQLCQKILCAEDDSMEMQKSKYPFVHVMVLSPFNGFFDRDIQCLVGLQTLCLFFFPMEKKNESLLEQEPFGLKQLAESVQCGVNLASYANNEDRELNFFSLRKKFLAKFLLLKMAIDTGQRRSTVFSAYRQMDSRLHFEHVIHRFVYRRLKNGLNV